MRILAALVIAVFSAPPSAAGSSAPLPAVLDAGPRAQIAQAVPPSFLPWPPAVPVPAPSGSPPAPSADPGDPRSLAATLEQVLAAVQNMMDRLWQWLDLLRQAAADALSRVVVPLPGDAPAGAGPADIAAEIAALPARWRDLIAAARAKLGPPDQADTTAVVHKAHVAASPQLSHEADTIAAADQEILSGVVQHEIAIAATAAVADAAAHDTTLPAAAGAARAAGDQLVADAQNLPSSRAGIELLVAGMGAGLRHEAAFTAALAQRLTGLIQQAAQLSGQIGALATTAGVAAARDFERDRRALDAQLGVADAVADGGQLLRQLLEGAGDPAGEIHLDPLY